MPKYSSCSMTTLLDHSLRAVPLLLAQVEAHVLGMAERARALGLHVNHAALKAFGRKAAAVLAKKVATDRERALYNSFVASDHWVHNFLTRNKLRSQALRGEGGAAGTAVAASRVAEMAPLEGAQGKAGENARAGGGKNAGADSGGERGRDAGGKAEADARGSAEAPAGENTEPDARGNPESDAGGGGEADANGERVEASARESVEADPPSAPKPLPPYSEVAGLFGQLEAIAEGTSASVSYHLREAKKAWMADKSGGSDAPPGRHA